MLAADAIAAQADASQAEPAPLVRIDGRRCRPRHGHGGGGRRSSELAGFVEADIARGSGRVDGLSLTSGRPPDWRCRGGPAAVVPAEVAPGDVDKRPGFVEVEGEIAALAGTDVATIEPRYRGLDPPLVGQGGEVGVE